MLHLSGVLFSSMATTQPSEIGLASLAPGSVVAALFNGFGLDHFQGDSVIVRSDSYSGTITAFLVCQSCELIPLTPKPRHAAGRSL